MFHIRKCSSSICNNMINRIKTQKLGFGRKHRLKLLFTSRDSRAHTMIGILRRKSGISAHILHRTFAILSQIHQSLYDKTTREIARRQNFHRKRCYLDRSKSPDMHIHHLRINNTAWIVSSSRNYHLYMTGQMIRQRQIYYRKIWNRSLCNQNNAIDYKRDLQLNNKLWCSQIDKKNYEIYCKQVNQFFLNWMQRSPLSLQTD